MFVILETTWDKQLQIKKNKNIHNNTDTELFKFITLLGYFCFYLFVIELWRDFNKILRKYWQWHTEQMTQLLWWPRLLSLSIFFKWIFHCCTHKQFWWCWGFGLVMHSLSALLKLSRYYIYQSCAPDTVAVGRQILPSSAKSADKATNSQRWPNGGLPTRTQVRYRYILPTLNQRWANGGFLFKMAASNNRGFCET